MTGALLKSQVETLFDVVAHKSTSVELAFICPQPGCTDKSGHRSVNLKTGKTGCFICNKGGDFVKWARYLGYPVKEEQRIAQAADLTEVTYENFVIPYTADVSLPEGFIYCSDRPKAYYTELIGRMAVRKNLTLDDLVAAQVGFTRKDPFWEPYAIFPVNEFDQLVYFQGRTYIDEPGEGTKKFPTRKECPYSAKYWVYNLDEARQKKAETVIVVESILNVLSLKKKIEALGIENTVAICVFKHSVSKPQLEKIVRCRHIKEVCLLFDHDATRRSWDASRLLINRISLSVAEMPAGKDNKKLDPNDDVDAAWEAFLRRDRATPLSATKRILAQRHEIMNLRDLRVVP
jgi:hypothetical protein